MENEVGTKNSYFKYYASIIIIITIFLTIERIIFIFVESDIEIIQKLIIEGRDADYRTTSGYMDLGLFNFYDGGLPYFYWAYFLLFPFFDYPLWIGAYIGDALRLTCVLLIGKYIDRLTDDKNDILFFYIFSIIGYTIDASINNHNWIILTLLFGSSLLLKEDTKKSKILSGFLFGIAIYKNVVLVFVPVLLICKKMKIKDLIYYIIPLALLFLPYLIFPNYTAEMIQNWHRQDSFNLDSILFLLWRITQTAQLLFMCFILFTILTSLKRYKKEGRILLSGFAIFFYFILTLILFFY